MMGWSVVYAASDVILVVDESRHTVCAIEREEGVTPEDEQRARLIAASPDLLAASHSVATWLEARSAHYQDLGSHDVACDLMNRANALRAAISRARK